MSARFSRRDHAPDPEARPRAPALSLRPAMVTSELGEDVDIEREVGELVAALREKGRRTGRSFAGPSSPRFWGPGRFGNALWLAQRRGL